LETVFCALFISTRSTLTPHGSVIQRVLANAGPKGGKDPRNDASGDRAGS
jgi:hypothetical protein